MFKQSKIESEFKHTYHLSTAYIAQLFKPTGQYDLDRNFLKKAIHKKSNFSFTFKWDISEPGIYEKKEAHHYKGIQTSYFIVNATGVIIPLNNIKEVYKLLSLDMSFWKDLSVFRIQLLKLSILSANQLLAKLKSLKNVA